MKNLMFLASAVLITCILSSCAAPTSLPTTPTSTPVPPALTETNRSTATPSPTMTLGSTKTPTRTWTSTPTPTITPSPKPTATPSPDITPQPFHLARNIDVGTFPKAVFGNQPVSIQIGDYYYDRSPDIGPQTVVERLPSYPGFAGPVVHTKVDGPPATGFLMQHAFINVERAADRQIKGPWAFEGSYVVLQAPKMLVHTGWSEDPIISLVSVQMHQPDMKFRAAGGVRLLTDDGIDYYASMYRVNRGDPGNTPDYSRKVKFQIGIKQGLRVELFYDPENKNQPTIRGFLIHYDVGQSSYEYIGQLPLAPDINPVLGDITWLGGYVGDPIRGYEVIAGEGKVYR